MIILPLLPRLTQKPDTIGTLLALHNKKITLMKTFLGLLDQLTEIGDSCWFHIIKKMHAQKTPKEVYHKETKKNECL